MPSPRHLASLSMNGYDAGEKRAVVEHEK